MFPYFLFQPGSLASLVSLPRMVFKFDGPNLLVERDYDIHFCLLAERGFALCTHGYRSGGN